MKVVFELLDTQPRQGSIYGGTKLTITGGPFTTEPLETIVKVGGNWWDGFNQYCYVLSVTEDTVTCRLAFDLGRKAEEYPILLFASTSEESNCEMDNDCKFTFIAA